MAAVVLVAAVAAVLLSGVIGSSGGSSIAAAINLHASDLPGFTVEASQHSGTGEQMEAQMSSCLGPHLTAPDGGRLLENVVSPMFKSGAGLLAQQVRSHVMIRSSADAADSDLESLSSRQLSRCLARTVEGAQIPTSSGAVVSIGDVHLRPLRVAVSGADRSLGLRTTLTMSAFDRSVPIVVDLLGYRVGRDELMLMTTGIEQPVSSQSQRALAALLVGRALARPH